jgi:glycosyltransferase involved in cell wall biosynthesis
MKIIMFSPNQRTRWNRAHQLFRDEIGEHHEVIYIGPGFEGCKQEGPYNAENYVKKYRPDCVMTYGPKYTFQFHNLAAVKVPKIHFAIDLFGPIPGTRFQGTIGMYKTIMARDKYDIFFTLSTRVEKYLKYLKNEKVHFLPFGFPQGIMDNYGLKRSTDVMTSMSVVDGVYPNRSKIIKATNELKIVHHEKRVFGDTFTDALNRCKIGVNSVPYWPSFNLKYLEVMACGALLFTDHAPDSVRAGLKPGRHFVEYEGVDDYKENVLYYLENDFEREKIAEAGYKETHKKHTNAKRVKEMTKVLEKWI